MACSKIRPRSTRHTSTRSSTDRLLHSFRLTSGITSTATPYGGWEKPDCELRGHFNGGHYLSAVALAYASSGNDDLRKKGDTMVAELARCQKANSNGYLSAFPETEFETLAQRQQRLGALLHPAQDHGRPARHVRPHRQQQALAIRRRHGRLGAAPTSRASATISACSCCAPSTAA